MAFKFAGALCLGAALHSTYKSADAASAYLAPYPSNPANSTVFFDIARQATSYFGMSSTEAIGRIEMELFDDTVPITARNFRELCRGQSGRTPDGKPLSFENCVFHRIIPNFMIQGGDITRGNGTGGCSIYGTRFRDESFAGKAGKHRAPGILSMANAGPNTNGSQFFICTVACPWLDGKHVVFGQVTKGYEHVKTLESFGTPSGKPAQSAIIAKAGVLQDAK